MKEGNDLPDYLEHRGNTRQVPREPGKFCDGCRRKTERGGVVTALAHSFSVNSAILLARLSVSAKVVKRLTMRKNEG